MPANDVQMVELRLKKSELDTYGLPDIACPVPMKAIEMGLETDELPLSLLLFYLQRSNVQTGALRTDIDVAIDRVGGYSRARALEQVFGGVTRSLLEHSTIPVLFSH